MLFRDWITTNGLDRNDVATRLSIAREKLDALCEGREEAWIDTGDDNMADEDNRMIHAIFDLTDGQVTPNDLVLGHDPKAPARIFGPSRPK